MSTSRFAKLTGVLAICTVLALQLWSSFDDKFEDPFTEAVDIVDSVQDTLAEAKNATAIVFTAYYYDTSKILPKNSVVVLLNAPRWTSPTLNWTCHSSNGNSSLTSTTVPLLAQQPDAACQWLVLLVNCTTVSSPTTFGLSTSENASSVLKVDFELPETAPIPVAVCFSPMFLEERWQAFVLATELYYHFGADLQVHYLTSAIASMFKLFKAYEDAGIVKIIDFPAIELGRTEVQRIGVNPMQQLEFRNQPLAYNDCLLRYRESAEFIVVGDLDDVLIPLQKRNYLTEFHLYQSVNPKAGAFMYPRRGAITTYPTTMKHFHLGKILGEMIVERGTHTGKSVYQTAFVKTAWIHWPGIGNETTISVPADGSMFLHIRNSDYLSDHEYRKRPAPSFSPLSPFFDPKVVSSIAHKFQKRAFMDKFHSLRSFGFYNEAITRCYLRIGEAIQSGTISFCPTPATCTLPPVPGSLTDDLKCVVAKQYLSRFGRDSDLTLFIRRNSTWREERSCS